MNDTELKSLILTGTGKLKRNAIRYIKSDIDIINFCETSYPGYESEQELLYRIKNNIHSIPVCPICGKKLKFLNSKNSFQHHCSSRCATLDPKTQDAIKHTCLIRHGVERYTNKEQFRQTCLERYNSNSPLSSTRLRNKGTQTKIERYGDANYNNSEKRNKTCLERYGSKCPAQSEENRVLIKQKFIEKYGAENFLASDMMKQYRNNEKAQERITITKRMNNTFNSSKPEDEIYILLLTKFKSVERNYNQDSRYPFHCDFYIKDIDCFIEINFHWTHGKHPFNESYQNDIEKLNLWKTKNSKFYNKAIEVWTIKDVTKRKIAKENKLNYFEFFNEEEFNNWFNNI